ncbi:hypothetical protein LR48_Vigan11g061100 [Vigna angularis]|uniref:Ubiquitin-like protease family profile domain-containing protein n=1 Tax=Phaseolus angularis TaxID=3914 RepID=A0A0L9VRK6_PHAAN|nr:hypothetical protein LR48_Vigan11g061100 [Vigna angularis]
MSWLSSRLRAHLLAKVGTTFEQRPLEGPSTQDVEFLGRLVFVTTLALHRKPPINESGDTEADGSSFTRPQKQPIHDTVIHEDDDMAEAEDDPLSKLMTKLPRLKKAPLELYWDLRVFGIPPHVPVYITLSDALEMIGGDRMLNISIIQLWCMKMKNDLRTMLQGVIGKSRGQLVQILYPKCNQQLDSWECGFYVMCWIKTIIRAVITDD